MELFLVCHLVSERVSEKVEWCWFSASQSHQGHGSAGRWSERYQFWNEVIFSVAQSTNSVWECLLLLFSREERSILCVGTWERQTADPHHLQEPPPRVEQSLHSVSLCLFFFSLVTPCVEDCNKLKLTVVPMGQIVTYMWSACFCVQPRQRYSRRSGGDRLWWGWRQGARLPWKSRRSSALGTR